MGTPSSDGERTLEFAPTWALALVATIFVAISFMVERLLHWLGHFLQRTKRKALFAALVKIKDELMLVGFISMAMVVLQTPISKICISSTLYDKWTPCYISDRNKDIGGKYSTWQTLTAAITEDRHGRRLLAEDGVGGCPSGKEPFIPINNLHQLHIFIFILAAVHVVYSCLTMLLALVKVHSWKRWEREAQETSSRINFKDLANSITFTRMSSFQKYHSSMGCSSNTIAVWVICFFQQMYIPRADYITLRQGFTSSHRLGDDYDFDAYMVRCMEDEFQKIVGISAKLWIFVVLFLLFNVHGVHLYFWSSFIPVILVLVIGTKLQYVIATLALDTAHVPGACVGHLLRPRDELFWFGRPELVLSVLHLVLFQNAFELATFLWHLWTFGFRSCLLEEKKTLIYIRLGVGLGVQLFVSISTLPLYALVSQMGTNYHQAMLPTQVGEALQTWHKDARKRLKMSTILSFGHKRNRSTSEDKMSLRPEDADDSSMSAPTSLIMGDISIGREEPGQSSAKKSKSPRDLELGQ